MKKIVCAALALALIIAAAACLAEATPEPTPETVYERETVIAGFEQLDDARHIGYSETWEYPLVDGQRGSGRPVAEDDGDVYTQPHHFSPEGVCADCNARNTAEPGTFLAASGAVLKQGAPAAEVLKQVLGAIPAETEIALDGVETEIAGKLIQAVRADAAPEAIAEILAGFPTETVDETECRVVALSYTGADKLKVREAYAFAAADCAFIKLY